ncbi:unnamed protein product, partial [Vitis vinifera]
MGRKSYANKKTRGAFIAAVFAMQGFGILAGGIVSLIVSAAFDHKFKAPCLRQLDTPPSLPRMRRRQLLTCLRCCKWTLKPKNTAFI